MNDLDRGAVAAIDLLLRAALVTEDETSMVELAEGIRAAIAEGGIALAVCREREFEATLDVGEDGYSVEADYGLFPPDLAALEGGPE